MADRRYPSGTGMGAPGSTGAFETSDPLGAPGSTGAGITHRDPAANIPSVGSDYQDPNLDYSGGGGQQQQLRDLTSADYGTGKHQQQQHRDASSDYGQKQQFREPTSGVYSGDQQQQQQMRDPTSGVIWSGDELERDRAGHGPVGVTGFTRVTTAAAPGGGVLYGRETVARAEKLGSAGAGSDDPAKEIKDRVQGGNQ